ncbi:TPA: hypothetical protein R8X70_000155 [Campylobacter coli]|nr:glycosyltransferase family 1 protein [Campylobacter coli]EAI4210285.1 glycosyltransferase [Campylobacter coli]EAI7965824.1 glycosyltransferase [Campylobacter coli]EAJ1208004.1 glycosyltransferase [Campylobacter coli]EAJ2342357.1 glycosyltransferase [Campylobacter coli]
MINVTMQKNVYFFYPSKILGGAELLFIRVANYLAQYSNDIEIGYIGLCDDIALLHLQQKIRFVVVNDGIRLPDNTVIISHPAASLKIPRIIGNDICYIFWILHIKELESFLFSCKMNQNEAYSEFCKMVDDKSVICMDNETYNVAKKFVRHDLEYPCIVPVMLDNVRYTVKKQLNEKNTLNIAWIGRLSEDKIYALINLMERLEKIRLDDLKIKLHIVGEGPYGAKLFKDYKNFSILTYGSIQPKELSIFLEKNIDLVFAMGTSMLEAEKLGIPSALVFYTEKITSDNCFLWSFKLKEYCLGMEDKNNYKADIVELESIIGYFLKNIQLYSIEARKHFEQFLIDKQIYSFVECVNNTEYTNEALRQFYNRHKKLVLKNTKLKNKIYLRLFNHLKRKLTNKGLLFYD